ncbi:MAG: hypothetical protein JO218_01120 [Burkholderiales bacterium]|nr:hypothetical protein [Burkholderiales bacterium]
MMAKLRCVGLFTLLLAGHVAARETAPALPAQMNVENLPPLGPLFFTPAERDELDRIRVGIASGDDAQHASRTMQFNGMMQKNGGNAVIWINGERYRGRPIAGATVASKALSDSTIVVHLPPPDARDMSLHVGQTLDPAGGNLREVYQRPPQELNQLLQLLAKRGAAPAPKAEKGTQGKAAPGSSGAGAGKP